MGATFQNRWEENQKNLYSKEAEEKARGKTKKAGWKSAVKNW